MESDVTITLKFLKIGGFWKFEKFDVLKVFKVRRILSKTSREIARSIDKRSIIPSDLSDTSNTIYIYYINKKNSLRDEEESKSPSEIVPQTFAIISSRVGWYRLPLRLVGEYRLNRTESFLNIYKAKDRQILLTKIVLAASFCSRLFVQCLIVLKFLRIKFMILIV